MNGVVVNGGDLVPPALLRQEHGLISFPGQAVQIDLAPGSRYTDTGGDGDALFVDPQWLITDGDAPGGGRPPGFWLYPVPFCPG